MPSLAPIAGLILLAAAVACGPVGASSAEVPPPQVDATLAARSGQAVAVVAGGCFWGVESVYRHTRGVTRAVSGYAGGTAETAHDDIVNAGSTDHAESVEVTYDPSVITYGQILRIFFAIAHNPTERDRQGPDVGRQYRSAIFTIDAEQDRIATAYIAQLNRLRTFDRPLATTVATLPRFYPAEAYHQNYAALHPDDVYIRIHDAPKLDEMRRRFPELFVPGKTR